MREKIKQLLKLNTKTPPVTQNKTPIVTYPDIPPRVMELSEAAEQRIVNKLRREFRANMNGILEDTTLLGIVKSTRSAVAGMNKSESQNKAENRSASGLYNLVEWQEKKIAKLSKTVDSYGAVLQEILRHVSRSTTDDGTVLTKEFFVDFIDKPRPAEIEADKTATSKPVKAVTPKRVAKHRHYGVSTSRLRTRMLNFIEVTVIKRLLVAGFHEVWIASHMSIDVSKVTSIGYGYPYSRVLPHLHDLTIAACRPLTPTPKISVSMLNKFVTTAQTTNHKLPMSPTDMVVLKGMVAAGSTNAELAKVFNLPRQGVYDRIAGKKMQAIGAGCSELNIPFNALLYGHERAKLERQRRALHELGKKVEF